jgi:hypothetical protein
MKLSPSSVPFPLRSRGTPVADLDELLARMAKDAALLNAYHEWEMPAPAPAEAINYASVADRIERAAAAIASLREALKPFDEALDGLERLAADRPDSFLVDRHLLGALSMGDFRNAHKALSPTQKPGNGE